MGEPSGQEEGKTMNISLEVNLSFNHMHTKTTNCVACDFFLGFRRTQSGQQKEQRCFNRARWL